MPDFVIKLLAGVLKRRINLQEGPMDGTKKWWQSQTMWAGVVALLRGLYQVVQVTLPMFTSIHLPPIPPIADSIIGTVLGGTVIHGRYTADTTIE